MMELHPELQSLLHEQPYPFLFVTVSGAHLYGFPSPNSDWDLRGAHIRPAADLLGLRDPAETIEFCGDRQGPEADLVTHEVKKFFRLLLRPNGYVLEQLTSPLIVFSTPQHEEVKGLVPQLLTRYHAHHYLGFAATQWKLFEKDSPRKVKPLLYVYRVLLTGLHLMKTGTVQANLVELLKEYYLPAVPELIERKLSGPEKQTLPEQDFTYHENEFQRLIGEMEIAKESTDLPEQASAEPQLNDLLIRLRLDLRKNC